MMNSFRIKIVCFGKTKNNNVIVEQLIIILFYINLLYIEK